MPETRAVALGPQQATLETREDSTMLVRSPFPLPAVRTSITDYLTDWAARTPDAIFVARRDPAGAWVTLTYAQTLARVERLAAGLLARNLDADRPVAILSGNSIEHLLLGFAAMHIAVPYAPVSTAYSLVSRDYEKLRHIIDLLTPGLIFADDGAAYGAATRATAPSGCEIVTRDGAGYPDEIALAALEVDDPLAVSDAHSRVTPDTIAKFLFTSGSTGMPKGVVNTQRMLCTNVVQIGAAIPEVDTPQVMVDWLPWNHTFGGNHNIHIALRSGGTLYIDDGRPRARWVRRDCSKPEGDRADLLLQRAEGVRDACAASRCRSSAGGYILQPAEIHHVCRREPAAACVGRA